MEDLIYDWNRAGERLDCDRRVTFDDETLRDGLQSPSVTDPPIEKKVEILHLMERIGIQAANIGLPGAGANVVRDTTRLAEEIQGAGMRIRPNCAARTVLADIRPIHEIVQKTGLAIEVACFIGSSEIRRYTEEWDIDRMERLTAESVRWCVDHGLDSMYVTEDTTRANPETIRRLYTTAVRSGASAAVVCDTVGHATPTGAMNCVRFVKEVVSEASGGRRIRVDWHGHNDRGIAVANAMAAIAAGADQVHGCALGIGERVGNTPLDLLMVNLRLMGVVGDEIDLHHLPAYCRVVSEATGHPIPSNYPVVGSDAFETATGVHAAAVIKAFKKGDHWLANRVYSGVPAEEFGLEQVIRVGPMSGRSNVVHWLERRGYPVTDEVVDRVFAAAKVSSRILADDEIRRIVEETSRVDEWGATD